MMATNPLPSSTIGGVVITSPPTPVATSTTSSSSTNYLPTNPNHPYSLHTSTPSPSPYNPHALPNTNNTIPLLPSMGPIPTPVISNIPLPGAPLPFMPPMMFLPPVSVPPLNATTPPSLAVQRNTSLFPNSYNRNTGYTTAQAANTVTTNTWLTKGSLSIEGVRGKGDKTTTSNGDVNDKHWTEHTSNDGKKYYYNSTLGISQWDKPDELKSADELKYSLQTTWKEYAAADGRSYWYNRETKQSVWEVPEEIKKLKVGDTNNTTSEEWTKFETKAEAREHFKILFDEKAFAPKTSWEVALKSLENDKRWAALAVLTKGEKKQLFSEYISQSMKRVQEEDRLKRRAAREHVVEALSSWEDLSPDTKYTEFAKAFYEEKWWDWIDEKEKDEIFESFMDEYERTHRDKHRKRRKECMEMLKQTFEKNPKLNFLTNWKDAKLIIKDDENFKYLDKSDSLSLWEEYVMEGLHKQKERLKILNYRKERKHREAFEELLNEFVSNGVIDLQCDWMDVVEEIQKDERYLDMIGQRGSTPRELFDEKLEALIEKYEDDKDVTKSCLRKSGLVITPSTTFESFYESINKQEEMADVSRSNAELAFHHLQKKVVEKQREHQRKKMKRLLKSTEPILKHLLEDMDDILDYEKAVQKLKDLNKFEDFIELCSDEETMKLVYQEWLSVLKVERSDIEGDTDEEGFGRGDRNKKRLTVNELERVEEQGEGYSTHHRGSRSRHSKRSNTEEDERYVQESYSNSRGRSDKRRRRSKSNSESDYELRRKSKKHRKHHRDDSM